MIDNNDFSTEELLRDEIEIGIMSNKNEKDKEPENKNPKKRKRNAKEISLLKRWDIILIVLYTALAALLTFFIWSFNVLPLNWLYILIGILSIFLILGVILTLIKMPVWAIWIKRTFILLLCIALGFGSFYVKSVYDTLSAITKPETQSMINISIITKKDSDIEKLDDLTDKKIGAQNGNDKENSEFVRNELQKKPEISNITYDESLDYTSIYNSLMNDEIDAMIITDSNKNLLKNNFATFEEDTRVIEIFQKERTDEVSTSNKDIRYETFTVMITGIDSTGDPNENTGSDLSDVNMLLIVNPRANNIQMVSLPRDAFLPNPALGNENDKLTHTGNNGPENTVKAIEELTGIDIDFYAKVSFTSIIEIVDALGGIECDVEIGFTEQDENRTLDVFTLEPGLQHINGGQALAYARHRHTEGYGDIGRTRAQQRVIQGILNKLTSAEGVANANAVLKVAQKYVATNMPMEQITNFISYELDRIKPWKVDSFTIEAVGDMLTTASMGSLELSVQLLIKDSVQKLLDVYYKMEKQMLFNEFSFDLDDLEKDRVMLNNSNILYAGMNTSMYKNTDDYEEPVEEEEEETPPVEQPDKTVPEVPKEPEVPVTPPVDPNPPVNPDPPVDPNPPVNPDPPVTPTP